MEQKINILDIEIDNCTAKEAMKRSIEYLESDPINVIEFVTVDDLVELESVPRLKEEIQKFDMVLSGDCTILEAANITDAQCLREVQDRIYLRMFLRYLARKHKRIYLLVETEEEGQKVYGHFENFYPGAQIAGMAKVSAKNRADDMLVNAINGAEADCILSTLPSPLQEELVARNKGLMNVRVWIGLGKCVIPTGQSRFGQGKISRFFKKQILKKEIEKRKKRGN